MVVMAGAAVLAAVAEAGPSPNTLTPALRRVCHAQPAMGAVLRLAARALEAADSAARREDGEGDAAREVAQAVSAFVADFALAGDRIVSQAADLLPTSGWVGTYSRSSLVERALVAAAAAGRPLRVLLAEGRPQLEGRDLARRLSESGVPCWLTVDAGAALLLPQAGALLVGADAVLPRTFVNKVGTYALLLAAREHNVPVYALAQRAKFIPGDARLFELGEREASEVWEDAPHGVSVRNPAFEEIPLSLVRGLQTEDGVIPPGEAGAFAAGLTIPEGLLPAWGAMPGED
jgi:translation initiation factor 2B subunit (eIF-2B alpha/beta/delta family)